MQDCVFCKIAQGELSTTVLYEDDDLIAFPDLDPKAPQHVLIIPKRHVSTLNDVAEEDAILLGRLMLTARQLAQQLNIAESGYRVLMNCNKGGGQAVFHIHLHLLGGRTMQWPPG